MSEEASGSSISKGKEIERHEVGDGKSLAAYIGNPSNHIND